MSPSRLFRDAHALRNLRRPLWPHLRAAGVLSALILGGLAQAESPVPDVEYEPIGMDEDLSYGEVVLSRSRRGGPQAHQAQGPSAAESPLEARHMGAAWLTKMQHSDGGWGAGDWNHNASSAPSDVATTSVVVLALMRDDASKHRAHIEKGVSYVVGTVKRAPKDSPRLDTPQGTQPQVKLGELADTHLASLMLSEVHGSLNPDLNREVSIALDAVIGKVQMAQRADGSFDGNGWAPVLSNSVAAMGLMRAREIGKEVDDSVLDKAKQYQDKQVPTGGTGGGGGGGAYEIYPDLAGEDVYLGLDGYAGGGSDNAGVDLYSLAGALNTAEVSVDFADEEVAGELEARAAAVRTRISADADGVIAGFGSVGGEEMLSYMMISDALASSGGPEWTAWEGKMNGFLVGLQNADGSWVGHHCITSPVFVTAGAVLTLGSGDAAGRGSNSSSVGKANPTKEGTLPSGARLKR